MGSVCIGIGMHPLYNHVLSATFSFSYVVMLCLLGGCLRLIWYPNIVIYSGISDALHLQQYANQLCRIFMKILIFISTQLEVTEHWMTIRVERMFFNPVFCHEFSTLFWWDFSQMWHANLKVIAPKKKLWIPDSQNIFPGNH
jgi:hypothetical protein